MTRLGRVFPGSLAACLLAMALAGLCLAQDAPVAGDYAARVVSLAGQVSVLRDSQPWALNAGDSIKMQQVIVTGPDGHAMFQVSDGSTFEVFPNSNVIFRNNPPNWRDLLDVLVGKIKVHIERLGGQPNPNRIHTPTAVISVRGTTFDVAVDEETSETDVAVEEGQVDVRHALHPGAVKVLNAGESVRVYRDEPLAQSRIDKGAAAQRLMRGLSEAVYLVMLSRGGRGVGGITPPGGATGGNGGAGKGGSTGGGTSGGNGPLNPPPPPPPPPPAGGH